MMGPDWLQNVLHHTGSMALAGTALLVIGMTLVIGGIHVAALFVPGTRVILLGLLVIAATAALRLRNATDADAGR